MSEWAHVKCHVQGCIDQDVRLDVPDDDDYILTIIEQHKETKPEHGHLEVW